MCYGYDWRIENKHKSKSQQLSAIFRNGQEYKFIENNYRPDQ